MAFLFQSTPKIVPEFTGLQVMTAVQALPIPIIYGAPRISVNLIYMNGFNSQMVSTGGKKGGGGKGPKQVEYFATLILALGEGEIDDVFIIYQDQAVYTPATFPTNGTFFFTGTSTQMPWDYVVSNWPDDARPYKDLAYYGFPNAELDASATVPQINLVPKGKFAGTCPLNNSTITISSGQYDNSGNPLSYIGDIVIGDCDADPATCIYDFLTNSTYGAGFPAALVDEDIFSSGNATDPDTGDSALQTYCQAVGFGWSVHISNAESANSILERWTKNLVVAPVWTGELLKFIPYYDSKCGLNPGYDADNPDGIQLKYFTPNLTVITTVTLDHCIQSDQQDEDPITFERVDPQLVYNSVRVDFNDRMNFFNDNVAEAKDEAQIELYGIRVDNIGLADEFSFGAYANNSAQIQLRRNISIRRHFTWRMNPFWAFLDPMDLLEIPDPSNWGQTVIVRITKVTDDDNEISTYTAEEWRQGSQAPSRTIDVSGLPTEVTGVPPTVDTTPPNQGITNPNVTCVTYNLVFEPTSDMLTGTGFAAPQVIVGATSVNAVTNRLDGNWGGCFIWISVDDVTYTQIGTVSTPSTIGPLVNPLPGYISVNPDNVNTLRVNLADCNGMLFSVPATAAETFTSLCVIQDATGFELLSYTTATLVTGNTYDLTGLYRGIYGTTSRLFSAGSKFMFLGDSTTYFEGALPPQYVGVTFWVKLQSFNIFHNYTVPLEDCVSFQYQAGGVTPVEILPPMRKPRSGFVVYEPE